MNIQIEPFVETKGVIYEDDTDFNGLYFKEELKTGYYNYYYSFGKHFKPKNIFEIGVRAGYTGYFLLKGSKALKYRGIDLETYLPGGNKRAESLLKKQCDDVKVTLMNSHDLSKLDELYDLIHIDGDHSYDGKIQDLELALDNLSPGGVIVVDDYNYARVGEAIDVFASKHSLKKLFFDTYTGHVLLMR